MNNRRGRAGIGKLDIPGRAIESMTLLFRTILLLLSLNCAFEASAGAQTLRLATTTTTVNSGLMDYLLARFSYATGIEVHVIAVGTGEALRLGEDGDVDAILVHSREAEDAFVASGHGIDRIDVMYNDFVIVGPRDDPASLRGSSSASEALVSLQAAALTFVSRGDDSGTHRRELMLWREAGIAPAGSWYREVGQGMGKTLLIADQLDAYTLTDRGTWLAYRSRLGLELIFEGRPPLQNRYGITAVNPARHQHVNYRGAGSLIHWLASPEGRQSIRDFRIDGEMLFTPAADNAS